jgi:hypothetical protein
MKIPASMSEIVRVGGWALRGAGFPFGVAERGTRLLAFTEAVHGGAVRDICDHEPIIAGTVSRKPIVRSQHSNGLRELDGGGRHLIEAGPPLVDLATCDARLRGEGHARISHVAGFLFITALADLLARRRLTGLCAYRADAGSRLPPAVPRSGWILYGWRDNHALFATGLASDPNARDIVDALGDTTLARAVKADLQRIAAPGEGELAIAAFGAGQAAGDKLLALFDRASLTPARRDYAGQVAACYRDGVPMEPKELQDLYDLEIRTWAPTSERSRSQAGYGKF